MLFLIFIFLAFIIAQQNENDERINERLDALENMDFEEEY